MSLLLFQLSPESVIVATDTLATRVDGRPFLLVSKCMVLPHLGSVIAFTGTAGIGQRWAAAIHANLLCRDFDMLDQHTPDSLRLIATEMEDEQGPISGSSTVYHFGYSEMDEQYVGFAYRSEKDFASERLPCGFGIKPPPTALPTDNPATIEAMVELADQIRGEQNALPLVDRLHIGGELVFTVLAERHIYVNTVHRFGDFDAQWQAMNDHLREDNDEVSQH
ncbi:MAG: hypothetical protein WB698_15540 [Solirubrobacteraceae bacterium]